MTVAVLMSTYNGEKYLRTQIDSVLAQQGDFRLELWVRDDGSADGTCKILEEYAQAGKLKWYTGKNLKPAHSFWDLILHCPGYDYYAFADQDDAWKQDKLQMGISALEGLSVPAFFFGNAQLVDQNLQPLGRNVYKKCPRLDLPTLSCAGEILGCTIVFNAALARLIQERPAPEKMIMHDFYLALICLLAGGTARYSPEALLQYRQHGNNVVGVSGSKAAAIKDRLRTVFKSCPVTVAQQTECLLRQYPETGTPAERAWLQKLTDTSLFGRLKIACSRKTRYVSKNKSVTLRLALLMGNR